MCNIEAFGPLTRVISVGAFGINIKPHNLLLDFATSFRRGGGITDIFSLPVNGLTFEIYLP